MCRDKVFAYHWTGENLYFVVFGEEGNTLRTVKSDGVPGEAMGLPEVYDNAYDVIAVLENGKTRVVVGVEEKGLFAMYFDLRDGSMSCEPIGSGELRYAGSFWAAGLFYLTAESKGKEGVIYRYDGQTENFTEVWRSQDRYILHAAETEDGRLGIESFRYRDGKMECMITDLKEGMERREISFHRASREKFCCDIGKYVIASNVLGGTRFFCVQRTADTDCRTAGTVRHEEDNRVELLDVGYTEGHEYEYLYCTHNKLFVYYESGATVSDLVLYDIAGGREAGRIRDVIPFSNCVTESGGKLLAAVFDASSQLRIYGVDLESYEISALYRYEEQEKYEEQELVFAKRKLTVTDRRTMDYIAYEQSGVSLAGTVCMLHGGPNTHWYPRYDKRICYMAEAGYKVFYPNYFGSSGYEKIDYTKDENKWGKKDALDIIRLGESMPAGERILYGESYGGFLAFQVWLKSPKLWDKVILYAPFFSPRSLRDASKDELSRRTVERCGQLDADGNIGKPEIPQGTVQNTEFYVIHGTEDQVVPCQESVKIVKFLLENFTWGKKEPQLHLLDGTGHSGGGIKQELRRDQALVSALAEMVFPLEEQKQILCCTDQAAGGTPMKTREQVLEFIQKQKVAFIASVDEDGFPNMKAMFAPRKIEGNCFYFSTNTSSMRSQQFMKNPKASIYFYHKGRFQYEGIMLTGTMEVLQNEEIKREIWCAGDTMYYRQGVTDPDYCVLKFTAQRGRHYCNLKTESFCMEDLA